MAFVTILTLLPLVVLISCASASTGYSTSDQQQLVDEHNKYRSSVSPKATDMLEMVSFVRNLIRISSSFGRFAYLFVFKDSMLVSVVIKYVSFQF